MKVILKIIYQASRLLLILVKPITIGVRILMVDGDQILLVKHVYEDLWYLPGGLVEKGETLEAAVRREAVEEVGASLTELHLYGTYTSFKDGRSDHIVVFISQDYNLNGQSDHEIEAISYFPLEALPEKISPGSKNRIDDYLLNEKQRYGIW